MHQNDTVAPPALSPAEYGRMSAIVACRSWNAAGEDWECPGCRRSKLKVLSDFCQNKPGSKKINNLIFSNSHPVKTSLYNLLAQFGEVSHLEMLCAHLGVFEDDKICHRCSGRKISNLRKRIPERAICDIRDMVGFSSDDILAYHDALREDGEAVADLIGPSLLPEIEDQVALFRGLSEIVFGVICRSGAAAYANARKIILAACEGDPRVLRGPKYPDIMVTPQSVVLLRVPAPSPEDGEVAARISSIAAETNDMVAFAQACGEDGIVADFTISENGVMHEVCYEVDGREIAGSTISMTPMHLVLQGVHYRAADHWDDLHKISEERNSLIEEGAY